MDLVTRINLTHQCAPMGALLLSSTLHIQIYYQGRCLVRQLRWRLDRSMSTYLLYGCGTSQGPQRPTTYPPDIILPGEANPPIAEAKKDPRIEETSNKHHGSHGSQTRLKSCVWCAYKPRSVQPCHNSGADPGHDVLTATRRADLCGLCVRKQ